MAQKQHYYIGVQTDRGMRFVTGIEGKMALWNKNEKPKEFSSRSYAQDIVDGLNMNLYLAVLVTSNIELEKHYFELQEANK